jgi:hypothetical protein
MANPMNVIFGATKLQMERIRGSSHVYKVNVYDGQDIPGVPTVCHAFENMAAVRKGFADFVEAARATGLSLELSYRQHPRCEARKFAGFDKASSAERVEVNPAFEDGTPYVADATTAAA